MAGLKLPPPCRPSPRNPCLHSPQGTHPKCCAIPFPWACGYFRIIETKKYIIQNLLQLGQRPGLCAGKADAEQAWQLQPYSVRLRYMYLYDCEIRHKPPGGAPHTLGIGIRLPRVHRNVPHTKPAYICERQDILCTPQQISSPSRRDALTQGASCKLSARRTFCLYFALHTADKKPFAPWGSRLSANTAIEATWGSSRQLLTRLCCEP